jgi:hypothetical protein
MSEQQILEVQQGVWIDEEWIRSAGLGRSLRVMVQPGEIRILAVTVETEEQESPQSGWDIFRSLGRDAEPGQLSSAAAQHDHYLYRKGQFIRPDHPGQFGES